MSITSATDIPLRPRSEYSITAIPFLRSSGADPHACARRQLSGWVAWQNRFNEKERTEKRQFANDFTKKLQSKQAEIQNLITSCNNEL